MVALPRLLGTWLSYIARAPDDWPKELLINVHPVIVIVPHNCAMPIVPRALGGHGWAVHAGEQPHISHDLWLRLIRTAQGSQGYPQEILEVWDTSADWRAYMRQSMTHKFEHRMALVAAAAFAQLPASSTS